MIFIMPSTTLRSDLEDDTNILNIDSSADLQSVTSSMNPTPSSLQFILRTQEISTDDDDDAITSDQDAADEGVLRAYREYLQEARKRDLRRICFGRVTAYRPKGQENFLSFSYPQVGDNRVTVWCETVY